MERVFTPDGPVSGQIILDKDEAHHLTRVRRCQAGSMVEAFDGKGNAWHCRLIGTSKDSAVLNVCDSSILSSLIATPRLTLATAVPKGERFEWLIEKATELGVSRIIPIICERSVVEPRSTKIDRLRKHIIEACKQCGRNDLMRLNETVKLSELPKMLDPTSRVFRADRGGVSAESAWQNLDPTRTPIVVCIGPEGGWTNDEQDWFESRDWQKIGLGPYILRIETAGVAAAAAAFQANAHSS